jgi:hypothetical protein
MRLHRSGLFNRLTAEMFNEAHRLRSHLFKEAKMADNTFLTAEEVSERYRGEISVGTLRNWRALRIGPTFVKIGKAVLYPADELNAWDESNKVTCNAPKGRRVA